MNVTYDNTTAGTQHPMKILMIAPQPFLEARGTPISVYQRLLGLTALGYKVDLLTYHIGQDVDIPGVTIERIPRIPFIKHVEIGPSFAKLILDFFIMFKAFWLLLTRQYDVIHSHEEGAFIANLLKPIFGVKHVYDMHSSLPHQLDNYDFGNNRLFVWMFRKLERWTLNTCDALITVGADLEAYAMQINPDVPHVLVENLPIQAFQNGNSAQSVTADVESLRLHLELQNKLTIVYTGNLEQYQGIDLLIESAEIVVQNYPNAVFLLVGGKQNQVADWKKEIAQRKLNGSVRLMGTVSLEEAKIYSALADILVSPRTDGLSVPLKIYTYLESGKPIVATNIAAHTLILDQDNAVLVDSTPTALAQGITQLIQQPELQAHLGSQARKLAHERYSTNGYLIRLREVYCLAKVDKVLTVS